MPISTGKVAIDNTNRDIFTNFNSWKTVASLIRIGATKINTKGMVIKEKKVVIAVKETDKAIFPSTSLVI